jgi:hypothetical protein
MANGLREDWTMKADDARKLTEASLAADPKRVAALVEYAMKRIEARAKCGYRSRSDPIHGCFGGYSHDRLENAAEREAAYARLKDLGFTVAPVTEPKQGDYYVVSW